MHQHSNLNPLQKKLYMKGREKILSSTGSMNQCWDIRVIWAVKFHMGALYAINSSMQDWQKEWGHVHQCVTTDHRPDLSDTQKNI